MSLPKRQHSKQRGRKRRTHWKAGVPSFSKCAHCQKPILSHRVCPFCGYYKSSQIMAVAVKGGKKTE